MSEDLKSLLLNNFRIFLESLSERKLKIIDLIYNFFVFYKSTKVCFLSSQFFDVFSFGKAFLNLYIIMKIVSTKVMELFTLLIYVEDTFHYLDKEHLIKNELFTDEKQLLKYSLSCEKQILQGITVKFLFCFFIKNIYIFLHSKNLILENFSILVKLREILCKPFQL